MFPSGLPVSRGVLKVRSPTLKSSFPAGRAVQLTQLYPLCWEVSLEALPWSLQKILDLGMLESPRNTYAWQSSFLAKGIDRDVCCACACLKSICFGAQHPRAPKAMQDCQEAFESTKSHTQEVIRNLRAVVME